MKYLNYILIIIGAFVAMYAKSGSGQNQFILIAGIVLLMIGVYRVSRTIPSRTDEEDNEKPEND
ncbi:hypothetical protein VOI54_16280 [Tamlana sp. 2201CG12-4]|uniref:hypothetical protein n=1 Tax=Tamlana sp. 2201CG12-4 TaxID=3112582 RepID=UPI002DBB16F7|nr:hypothetical protein [Tamlana sp. 2201CG12-4]MEC3908590.1 hypothetical protein [Tamlana sp. 2201CG12-4]